MNSFSAFIAGRKKQLFWASSAALLVILVVILVNYGLIIDSHSLGSNVAQNIRSAANLSRFGVYGEGPFPSFSPRPLGVMALGGSVLGVAISQRRQQCIASLLPLLLYLLGTFAVGDAVSRYLQPVEWIGFVLLELPLILFCDL